MKGRKIRRERKKEEKGKKFAKIVSFTRREIGKDFVFDLSSEICRFAGEIDK